MARPRRRQRTASPEQQEAPPPQQQASEDENEGVVGAGGKTILPGMYLDISELSSIEGTTTIIDNLQYLGWMNFARFNCNWYSALVEEFYASAVLDMNDVNPSIRFNVNGTDGTISSIDIEQYFDIPTSFEEIDLPTLEYPKRRWPYSWPLDFEDSVRELNNGRDPPTSLTRIAATRLNLRGNQRLALKLVIDCLLPVNNKDSVLTHLQTFVVSAIMHRERIHLPSLIIQHMDHEKEKSSLPYGMVICHLLIQKGVDVSGYEELQVPIGSRIGRISLKNQEIYSWQGELWSKWEVFQFFEVDRPIIWRHNRCCEPPAPRGWAPCGHNRAPLMLGDCSGSQPTHEPPPSSSRRLTDRELMESIAGNMQQITSSQEQLRMQNEQILIQQEQLRMQHQTFSSNFDDYQRRQNSCLQELTERLNMRDVYESLFALHQTDPPPSTPPPAPMD